MCIRDSLVAVGGERDPGHALRAVLGGDVGALFDLAATPIARTLRILSLIHI